VALYDFQNEFVFDQDEIVLTMAERGGEAPRAGGIVIMEVGPYAGRTGCVVDTVTWYESGRVAGQVAVGNPLVHGGDSRVVESRASQGSVG
jgi:hypothetical protein